MSSVGTALRPVKPLVTLSGECFDAQYENSGTDGRDGILYYFTVTDLAKDRGSRLVSMFRSGTDRPQIKDYDSRVEMVRLNVLRRAFDSGEFSFETPVDSGRYHELRLSWSDFEPQKRASDETIREFLKLGGYWMGFRQRPKQGNFFLIFSAPEDLDYLGVKVEDIERNLWLLTEQGYFESAPGSANARPKAKLVQEFEPESTKVSVKVVDADHKFARMAIDEARKSVPENDGRPHPWVGAVVVKDGKVLSTAHRGEQPGNHAEYVALEKKLSDEAVAGATVYTLSLIHI